MRSQKSNQKLSSGKVTKNLENPALSHPYKHRHFLNNSKKPTNGSISPSPEKEHEKECYFNHDKLKNLSSMPLYETQDLVGTSISNYISNLSERNKQHSPRQSSKKNESKLSNFDTTNNNQSFSFKNNNSFFKSTLKSTFYRNPEQQIEGEESKWTQNKRRLTNILRRSSQLTENKLKENNSDRKHYGGAQQSFESSKLMTITMSYFRTLDPYAKKQVNPYVIQSPTPRPKRSLYLPDLYMVQHQTSTQKKLFYSRHPYMKTKDNAKSLQRRIDKRKNLVKLEQLFIRKTNKQTKQIYVSEIEDNHSKTIL